MKKVYVSFNLRNPRQQKLILAVKKGLEKVGWKQIPHKHHADLCIVWGMTAEHKVMIEQRENHCPVLMCDLPYWNRKGRAYATKCDYKISLNGIHPTEYLARGMGKPGRYARSGGMELQPWRKSGHYILLAGIGPKGSKLYGYEHGWWDTQAVETIKSVTKMPILFRPKPSDKFPPTILGVNYDDMIHNIKFHFPKAFAVVTHHGNAAIEAMQYGVPSFCNDGAGKLIANSDLLNIENPVYSEERQEFFEQLAYWQWSYQEIEAGKPFMHLLKTGLIDG